MMQVNQLGVERLYSSSPGDPVEGVIGVENSGSAQTLDVLWSFGLIEGEDFSTYGYIISESVYFQELSSTTHETGSFATPDASGTWDLFGVLADDIFFDGSTINISGAQAMGIEPGAWTISGTVGEVGITAVSVGTPT